METIKNELPESMKAFVQKRAAEGYVSSDVGEYILDLIRSDQQLRYEERLDELLLEGLASGEPIEVDGACWPHARGATLGRVILLRVVVFPAAVGDVEERFLYYLDRGAPRTVRRWCEELAATFECLAGHPDLRAQTLRQALRGIRSWPVSGFERNDLFYRSTVEGIEVIHVLPRNLGHLMKPGLDGRYEFLQG